MLADTFQFRQGLAMELQASKTTSQAGALPSLEGQGRFDFGWVTSTGVVTLYGSDIGAVVILEPMQVDGEVRWRCVVHPERLKPSICR
jgi:hypothetical protein